VLESLKSLLRDATVTQPKAEFMVNRDALVTVFYLPRAYT